MYYFPKIKVMRRKQPQIAVKRGAAGEKDTSMFLFFLLNTHTHTHTHPHPIYVAALNTDTQVYLLLHFIYEYKGISNETPGTV